MGTISKITGIAIDSVSKLGGIAAASIAQMVGQIKAAAVAGAATFANDYSLDFDGSDDYVDIGDVTILDGATEFTISFWINFTSLPGSFGAAQHVISKGAAYEVSIHNINSSGGGPGIQVPGTLAIAGYTLSTSTWYHMAVTMESSGFNTYINGALESPADQGSGVTIANVNTPLCIGAKNLVGSSPSGFINAKIDEVAIWDTALTSGEIAEIYNKGTNYTRNNKISDLRTDSTSSSDSGGVTTYYTSSGDLVGYWWMGDGDTYPTITDHSSGSKAGHEGGNDGTMTNMTSGDIEIATPTASSFPYHKSLYLDGTNDTLIAGTEAAWGDHDIDVFTSSFELLLTASAAWTMEWDLMLHLGNTAWTNIMMYTDSRGIYGAGGGLEVELRNYNEQIWMKYEFYESDDEGNSGQYGYDKFDCDTLPHFSNTHEDGIWHRFTLSKGSGSALSTIKMYIDGHKPNGGGRSGWNGMGGNPHDQEDFDDERQLTLGQAGSDIVFGSFAFYSGSAGIGDYGNPWGMTQTQINENYDSNARSGSGAVTESKIMVTDPRTTSTTGSLVYYTYYDPSVDTGTTLTAKVGAFDISSSNCTMESLSSSTTPQAPLFLPMTAPTAIYETEEQSFIQPGSTSTSTVSWYSDSDRETLITSSVTYSFDAAAAGDHTLYTKDSATLIAPYGILEQTNEVEYTSYSPGYSTHSYDTYYGTSNIGALTSPTFPSSSFNGSGSSNSGDISYTVWFNLDSNQFTWFDIITAQHSGGYYSLKLLGSLSSYPMFKITTPAGVYDWYASAAGSMLTSGGWNHVTFSHKPSTGYAYAWANGVYIGAQYNTNMKERVNKEQDYRWAMSSNWKTKIANFAIYNKVFSEAEGLEIQNLPGGVGSSMNLLTASGSMNNIVEYWKINDDTYDNDSEDVLTGVSGSHIPVANSVAERKSTDRP